METLFVMFPLVVGFGFTVGLVREHIYIDDEMTWEDAQYHCRQNYRDLSTITTEEEHDLLVEASDNNDCWIGLHRSETNRNIFVWSDEEVSSFSKWLPGEPSATNEECVQMRSGGWFDDGCWRPRRFLCERILVLVKENKTWEEAYEYCRAHYTSLAFLSSQTQLDLAKEETNGSQTVSVWTGLRFLAGEWFWVNREPLASPILLPSCPAQPFRCGARNSQRDVWENRDCEEKLNFLCYE